jgi:hypothetical protein
MVSTCTAIRCRPCRSDVAGFPPPHRQVQARQRSTRTAAPHFASATAARGSRCRGSARSWRRVPCYAHSQLALVALLGLLAWEIRPVLLSGPYGRAWFACTPPSRETEDAASPEKHCAHRLLRRTPYEVAAVTRSGIRYIGIRVDAGFDIRNELRIRDLNGV